MLDLKSIIIFSCSLILWIFIIYLLFYLECNVKDPISLSILFPNKLIRDSSSKLFILVGYKLGKLIFIK